MRRPLALSFGLVAIGVRPGMGQRIEVGANVQVSARRDTLVHNEVVMAADRLDARHLVACTMAAAPGSQQHFMTIFYTSSDQGKTWEPTATDSLPISGDPTCAFGGRDTVYRASNAHYANPPYVRVSRSIDGGLTWGPEARILHVPDRPFMAVDRTGGKYHGRVYVMYNGVDGLGGIDPGQSKRILGLATSKDAGATFGNPAMRAILAPDAFGIPAGGVVLSNGDLVILHQDFSTPPGGGLRFALKALRSTDGGETMSPAILVSNVPNRTQEGTPSLAVDETSGPFHDRLYATWSDGPAGRSEIFLGYSIDSGKTWSEPVRVSDGKAWPAEEGKPRGPSHFMPTVAVNRDGIVGVMWYDRRDLPAGSKGWYVRFSASLDGGETWLRSVRVAEKPKTAGPDELWTFDPTSEQADADRHGTIRLHVRDAEWVSGGHTAGLAARADGVFMPLWIDDRTGRHQVFTAPVTVKGIVAKNGSADLAGFEDISSKLTVDLRYAGWDQSKTTLTLLATVTNTSREPIRGVVKIRALSIRSAVGEPEPLGAERTANSLGTVWDLTGALALGGLAPGASISRALSFRLLNVNRDAPYDPAGVLELRLRILNKAN